jgi:hypothetical protein
LENDSDVVLECGDYPFPELVRVTDKDFAGVFPTAVDLKNMEIFEAIQLVTLSMIWTLTLSELLMMRQ